MRNVNKRKIKSQVRLLVLLAGIFFVTLLGSVGIFLLFAFSTFRIISPLAQANHPISTDTGLAMTKSLCMQEHISCQQVNSLSDGSIQVTLDTGATVILSTQKDLKNQLASLQSLASQLTIKGKQLKHADFRFAHVVVAF